MKYLIPTLKLVTAAVWLSASFAQAEPAVELSISDLVTQSMQAFDTPGMSVAVVHRGEVVHLAGYGYRVLEAELPATAETYFRLASASKAFTAASVAILVDEGKLSWDDKVVDHLPEFRLQDPWVTAEFTIRDLLSHRSGLVGGAGDSMIWPEPSGFSRQEVIHNLRYLTPEFSFRSNYGYSNVFYITAAELVARLADQPWEDFVAQRIFAPLGMDCYAGDMPAEVVANSAFGYGMRNGDFFSIPRNGIDGKGLMSAAAGGLVCSAAEMTKWLQYLLGQYQQAEMPATVFSRQQQLQMWSPMTVMTVTNRTQALHQTNFSAYGLGWRMQDMHGHKVVHHTGTLSGYQAYVALVPELELGVVVLNNGSDSGARTAVMQSILDSYLAVAEPQNWIAFLQQEREEREQRAARRAPDLPVGTGEVLLPLSAYAGYFKDRWFGGIEILHSPEGLSFRSERMVNKVGSMEPFADHSFVIRWQDPNVAADTLIQFELDAKRQVIGFELMPHRVQVGSRHAYRDMAFSKVADSAPAAAEATGDD
ncbi:serine hydrolase [Alkalimonas amylolytica]|uniref:CubicO group peptidase, beta-lactamase class C family n=1 Tax=Alkalimonas amylolytica TaxID=152573 RepID=A0A1H4A9H1_ALKAM|nr:serine hydrolase [Alkalimonas amylolytica]SEA32428.1 CubicO group peptidase, beta-lactamase class C family [Alkalimonas amylolytica]